jgi:hypothetical protein
MADRGRTVVADAGRRRRHEDGDVALRGIHDPTLIALAMGYDHNFVA